MTIRALVTQSTKGEEVVQSRAERQTSDQILCSQACLLSAQAQPTPVKGSAPQNSLEESSLDCSDQNSFPRLIPSPKPLPFFQG